MANIKANDKDRRIKVIRKSTCFFLMSTVFYLMYVMSSHVFFLSVSFELHDNLDYIEIYTL
jgi:hypothetical protein